MNLARYSKFLTQLLVTLLQIGVVYSTTMDWRVAITAIITTGVVLAVPNLPQLPWLKAALAFVGAATQVLFAVSGTVSVTTVLVALVAGFGALGVYAVPNEDTPQETVEEISAGLADTPIETGFTNRTGAGNMQVQVRGGAMVMSRGQAVDVNRLYTDPARSLALAFSKVEA